MTSCQASKTKPSEDGQSTDAFKPADESDASKPADESGAIGEVKLTDETKPADEGKSAEADSKTQIISDETEKESEEIELCGEYKKPSHPEHYQCESDNWLCTIGDNETDIGCICGDYIITDDTACINEQPACNGKPVEHPISGFGCAYEDNRYECRFPWGCRAGNLICHQGQIFMNGKCTNPEQMNHDNKVEFGEICEGGDCLCGNIFCPKGSKCTMNEETKAAICVCGESGEIDRCSCDEDQEDSDEDPNPCVDGNYVFCRDDSEVPAFSSSNGLFSCNSSSETFSHSVITHWHFTCELESGCYNDYNERSERHFTKGGNDYESSEDISSNENYEYGRVPCPYHFDGTYNNAETKCQTGDCVVPLEHGICGAMDIHTGELTKYGKEGYDPKKCIGGTRYCHGFNNPPLIVPKESKGYICDITYYYARYGIKAWVCGAQTCICGDQICLNDMVCYNEKCITQKQVPDKNGNTAENLSKPDENFINTLERRSNGKPIYDVSYYTTDPEFLDYCGRSSAEDLKQTASFRDAYLGLLKLKNNPVPETVEPDRCRTRQVCDTWYVPRDKRNQYVCDHGLYTQTDKNNKIVISDRPLGLRCVDPKGCTCGDKICRTGSLCVEQYYNAETECQYDSIFMHEQCKRPLFKDSSDMLTMWDRYKERFYGHDSDACKLY